MSANQKIVSSLLDATNSKTFLAPISIHILNSCYYIKSSQALLTPEKPQPHDK